jgi:hypothetical protein
MIISFYLFRSFKLFEEFRSFKLFEEFKSFKSWRISINRF